ncbi:MAG: PTS sugar transporter subunit IIA [Proteobacteria bacterium]|nr:PTS sugar transporter subunit IIA [Pseudomonadota bacterium]
MIGMVLVSHGRVAAEMVRALEHIVGPQANVAAICIEPDDDMDKRRTDILAAIAATDDGNGVVVLTDMFGGTPSNLAISVMEQTGVEVLAGLNLPMLVKLASVRRARPLHEAVMEAEDAGRKYISLVSHLLNEPKP